MSTRIAAGEEECTPAGFLRLMDEGNIDVVQIDLTRVGFTQAMRVAALAQQRGVQCCNHNFTTDINVAASLHFLAAVPNALMLEYCVEPSPLRTGITRNPIEVVDGYAAVPEAPGLGIEVDLDRVANSFRNDLAATPALAVEGHRLRHEGKHPTIYRQCHSANEPRRR